MSTLPNGHMPQVVNRMTPLECSPALNDVGGSYVIDFPRGMSVTGARKSLGVMTFSFF